MSKLLNQLSQDEIALSVGLQRLLVIANKIHNVDLSSWVIKELDGYESSDELPSYRKTSSHNIIYSGINGRFQITNQPLGPGYLSEKTIEKIKDFSVFEGICDVEEQKKPGKDAPQIYRDLTFLAGEVYRNTIDQLSGIGVQCTNIRQVISCEVFSKIHEAVKTRVINILCSFEEAGIDIDGADVKIAKKHVDFESQNFEMYKMVVVDGKTFAYVFQKKENKVVWQILVPVLINLFAVIVTFLLTYYLT
jgi:hypothetical protein